MVTAHARAHKSRRHTITHKSEPGAVHVLRISEHSAETKPRSALVLEYSHQSMKAWVSVVVKLHSFLTWVLGFSGTSLSRSGLSGRPQSRFGLSGTSLSRSGLGDRPRACLDSVVDHRADLDSVVDQSRFGLSGRLLSRSGLGDRPRAGLDSVVDHRVDLVSVVDQSRFGLSGRPEPIWTQW
jgi:hypothetical protein